MKTWRVAVLLATDTTLRLSARNQLWGEVCTIHEGAVNDEVSLLLPSGRNVTAVITHGSRACAIFDSSSVILATYD
ncbi:TOBE domain-containing protein [Thauera sp. WH-1]|uniref:TOBE domain-containing protein n=1 Tax=Thauera sp. WH-1 TaxID=3398230 RepID=UPI0039FBC231